MRVVSAAAIAACLFLVPPAARAGQATQTQTQTPTPTPTTPQGGGAAGSPAAPAGQGTQPPTPAVPAGGVTAGPPAARAFTADTGLLFNTVKPEKVADFEQVIGYLQAALQKSTDPMVQAQARGWRVFKASEPGPNNTVLYVFVLDPAVPGADYGLGHILGAAYTDPAELQAIWKLYTESVSTGGTLLNLTPVGAAAAPETTAPAPFAPPDAEPKMLPPDADPNRR